MMLAWSFAARTVEEVTGLLRALGRHRYVRSTELALHWSVDVALRDEPRFAASAAAWLARAKDDPDFDPISRDPSYWRRVDVDDVASALAVFWTPGPAADRARARLREALDTGEIPLADHPPFTSDPEDPPHPELVLLDWELFPIDELDADRHAGALAAMEEAGEEVDVSAAVYQEGPCIAYPELAFGAKHGALVSDFVVWSDGPHSYSEYVFRGAARAAKLSLPPVECEETSS